MKDEIKEIIDDMKIVAEHKTVGVMGQQLNFKNARILLDYISNLQEEIYKKEAMYDSLAVDYRLSQEENEKLKKENIKLYKKDTKIINELKEELQITQEKWDKDKQFSKCRTMEMLDYKSRNEKAIEYIEERKNLNWYADGVFVYELLNILNGGDEE